METMPDALTLMVVGTNAFALTAGIAFLRWRAMSERVARPPIGEEAMGAYVLSHGRRTRWNGTCIASCVILLALSLWVLAGAPELGSSPPDRDSEQVTVLIVAAFVFPALSFYTTVKRSSEEFVVSAEGVERRLAFTKARRMRWSDVYEVTLFGDVSVEGVRLANAQGTFRIDRNMENLQRFYQDLRLYLPVWAFKRGAIEYIESRLEEPGLQGGVRNEAGRSAMEIWAGFVLLLVSLVGFVVSVRVFDVELWAAGMAFVAILVPGIVLIYRGRSGLQVPRRPPLLSCEWTFPGMTEATAYDRALAWFAREKAVIQKMERPVMIVARHGTVHALSAEGANGPKRIEMRFQAIGGSARVHVSTSFAAISNRDSMLPSVELATRNWGLLMEELKAAMERDLRLERSLRSWRRRAWDKEVDSTGSGIRIMAATFGAVVVVLTTVWLLLPPRDAVGGALLGTTIVSCALFGLGLLLAQFMYMGQRRWSDQDPDRQP